MRRWCLVAMSAVVIGLAALPGSAAAGPTIKIQVKRMQGVPVCDSANECLIRVKLRGIGACKSDKVDCSNRFEWELKGTKKLTDKHKVVIERAAGSSADKTCLDKQAYELTKANPKVVATVQNVNTCKPKTAWFYSATLYYEKTPIDRDDPGVIIDN